MCCINGSLVLCLKGGGEVGYVCSDVGLLAVKGKLEVVAGSAKLLVADGNALKGDYETNVRLKICSSEYVGKILNFNSLDGLVNDYEVAALGLLHSAVGRSGSGNSNGHTNLNACLERILVELVAVITALAVNVCEEEVVSGVACALSVDSNNDTCNGNDLAALSCHVILEGGYDELLNGTLVRNGAGGSVGSGNGSGDVVVKGLLGHLVNLDGPVGAALNCIYLVIVNCPSNKVLIETDHDLTYELIVSRSNSIGVLFLVKSVEVLKSCLNVVLRRVGSRRGFICVGLRRIVVLGLRRIVVLGLGRIFLRVGFIRLGHIGLIGFCRRAGRENGKAHKCNENNCN